jgi:SMI1-KNR4 cell-wall
MGVRIEGSREFGPLGEQRLAAFEAAHRLTLPPDYRHFLLAHNGGRPRPGCVNLRWHGRESAAWRSLPPWAGASSSSARRCFT